MNVLLRSAEDTDAKGVADVLITSRKAFLAFAQSPHSDFVNHEWIRNTLLPAGGVTVADLNGAVVGVLAISKAENFNWLDQLYIHPTYVGHGIGSKLLAHALLATSVPLRLYTFQENKRARAFYERKGFIAIEFSDGSSNEEQCPDVLYEFNSRSS